MVVAEILAFVLEIVDLFLYSPQLLNDILL